MWWIANDFKLASVSLDNISCGRWNIWCCPRDGSGAESKCGISQRLNWLKKKRMDGTQLAHVCLYRLRLTFNGLLFLLRDELWCLGVFPVKGETAARAVGNSWPISLNYWQLKKQNLLRHILNCVCRRLILSQQQHCSIKWTYQVIFLMAVV